MVKIIASSDTAKITIVGHGISIDAPFALDNLITLIPTPPATDLDVVATNSVSFEDYVAVVAGRDIASFAIQVSGASGAHDLAAHGWNALWVFHLLSLAGGAPCMPLFSVSEGLVPTYSMANRMPIIRPVEKLRILSSDQLSWARTYEPSFNGLIPDPRFSAAMLCYGNAHYLPDLRVRIMLLWAGIEGLLAVDGELNRRLALYATLLMQGSAEKKSVYFAHVKTAYGLRSKAVHGAHLPHAKLQDGYTVASTLLAELLARCVELGRVPSREEFDQAALSGIIT